MIIDVNGAASEEVFKSITLDVPVDENSAVRLNYSHLPDLPLLQKFIGAVTVNGNAYDVDSSTSIKDLVNILDAIVDNGVRVFYCWYNDYEFELCTGPSAVTLTAAFAAVLKTSNVLAAHTCYSSSLYESKISEYSHYAVRVSGTRGFYDGVSYNQVIAKVKRDSSSNVANYHAFTQKMNTIDLEVFVVKRDGTYEAYFAPEIWSLGLEIR